jgi:hypothetical protein
MRLIRVIFLAAFLFNFSSCQWRNTFDTRGGGYDYIRIPFIKPYEAIQLNGTRIWGMNLNNVSLNSSVYNIKKINVVNKAICCMQ